MPKIKNNQAAILVRLPHALKSRIDQEAADRERSTNELIREAIREWLRINGK